MSSSCRFIDSFGFEWQAYEVAIAPAAAPRNALYFFARGATRVVHEYPADWEHLSWADLEDLCALGRAVHSDGRIDLHPLVHSRSAV